MTEIGKAVQADRWDILDFANLVFSMNSAPHDLRKMVPKMYEDDMPFEDYHYLARENGRIVGLTAVLPFDICAGEDRIKVGFVGAVTTHPYRRGCGYMTACMNLLHEDMEAKGVQLFMLGGRKNRYSYYGYSNGAPVVSHRIRDINVEKALKDVDAEGIVFEEVKETPEEAVALHESASYYCVRDPKRYVHYMRSWSQKFYRVLQGGKTLGFCTDGLKDLELYEDDDLLKVIKAWVLRYGDVHIPMGLMKKKWNEILGNLAEGSTIYDERMVRVIDWPGVTEMLLRVRAREIAPLQDGEFRLGIENVGTLKITVKDGQPKCEMVDEPGDVTMDRLKAQTLLFSSQSLYLPTGVKNWLPLPLWTPYADWF